MININFVPDDYVQDTESHRTNLVYIVLFLVVMVGGIGWFAVIKMRQRVYSAKEELVNGRMAQAQEAIKQFEELQTKRKAMMKTALMTAELLEPVPRSVLLASLTNNLPRGVSLLRLKLTQKEPKQSAKAPKATNKYKEAQAKKAKPEVLRKKASEVHIDIEGVAPSDLQVAAYIERLSSSSLLDKVALVESKEYRDTSSKIETTSRQFKLKAMLRKEVHLSSEDINRIRVMYNNAVINF